MLRILKAVSATVCLSVVLLGGTADATPVPVASSSVDYGFIHGLFNITDTGSAILNLTPGQTVHLTGTWTNQVSSFNDSHCPYCIIQEYLAGLSPLNVQANLYGGLLLQNSDIRSGSYDLVLTAPEVIGTYYIGGTSTLQYHFINVNGSANAENLVNYQINVVPEPLTLSVFGAGIAALGALRRRKRKPE